MSPAESAGGGYFEDGRICEWCLALGVARCDCCDGSGWIAITYVPEELRHVVAEQRGVLAVNEMKRLLKRPAPGLSQRDPVGVLKRCGRLLLQLNRHMGVFENPLTAAGQLPELSRRENARSNKVTQMCIHTAAVGKAHMHKIMAVMEEASRLEAENLARKEHIRTLARKAAEFYDTHAQFTDVFVGTNLEHPFLYEAIGPPKTGDPVTH